ncbi:MAG: GGDEF domain-containing protein [Peptococcaceae bacterium]|nr:GGDEF domain-containing protein [Peptococcaceae bacterium]
MDQEFYRARDNIKLILENLLNDQPFPEDAAAFNYGDDWLPLYVKCTEIYESFDEMKVYVNALSKGDINIEAPKRENHMASSLKHFQAQLRHLIWQAECIARGKYNQKLDFMGSLSEVFNKMSGQLKDREEQLTAQQQGMTRIFDNLDPILIVEANDSRTVLYANQMAKERFQVQEDMSLAEQSIITFDEFFCQSEENRPNELTDADNQYWYLVTTARFPWSNYQDSILFHCVDVTSQKRHTDMLEHAAKTDEMTGLFNRRAFEISASDIWDLCRKSMRPLSIIMFDIDYFKKCNDTYGHQHGDACLINFSDVLKKVFSRSSDIVARYGGEEFIVALPFTSCEDALLMAEKSRKLLESLPINTPDNTIDHLTVSGGLACLVPAEHDTLEKLVFAADQALYKAKQSGRNQIVVSL